MVLLNPIPLNIIKNLDILKSNFGLTKYKYTVYKVNFSEKIIGFIEKDKLEKDKLEKNIIIFTILWQNEYDPNPYHQLNLVKFYHIKTMPAMEMLYIEQLDTNNFEIRTPTSINRYIYNLNTHLFKQYEIVPGKIYEMGVNKKTEMIYYKVPLVYNVINTK